MYAVSVVPESGAGQATTVVAHIQRVGVRASERASSGVSLGAAALPRAKVTLRSNEWLHS